MFSGSGSIVLFGGNSRLSVGFGGSGSILLFGLLVWFSSVFVALSLVENTSVRKKEKTNTIYFVVFIFLGGESGFRRLQRVANLIRPCEPLFFVVCSAGWNYLPINLHAHINFPVSSVF